MHDQDSWQKIAQLEENNKVGSANEIIDKSEGKIEQRRATKAKSKLVRNVLKLCGSSRSKSKQDKELILKATYDKALSHIQRIASAN